MHGQDAERLRLSRVQRDPLMKRALQRLATSDVDVRRLGVSLAALAFGVLVWYALTAASVVDELFLPSPIAIWKQFLELLGGEYRGLSLLGHAWASALRIAIGFVAACAVGIPLGLMMGQSRYLSGIVEPFIELYRPVPPFGFIPLLIIWFGIGELPKVILIFLGTVPVLIINTTAGVRSVKIERIRAAYCLGARRWHLFRYVIFPSALPSILTGMRVGIGVAWTCLVAAEMIAAVSGLGWMVLNSSRYLRTDIVFVGIIVIGTIGFLLDRVLGVLERRLVPWKGRD